jgi:hypothetical protein
MRRTECRPKLALTLRNRGLEKQRTQKQKPETKHAEKTTNQTELIENTSPENKQRKRTEKTSRKWFKKMLQENTASSLVLLKT